MSGLEMVLGSAVARILAMGMCSPSGVHAVGGKERWRGETESDDARGALRDRAET